MGAWVVLDLGFGDAGKGLVVDALVRRTGARTVLRFNGGAQAGHNVVTEEGRHHCFAQVGAGSFLPGVRTVLGPEVVVHPTALGVELAVLRDKGLAPRVEIFAAARLVSPWHQALNRLRELSRRERHGSCGVGIGEVVRDALACEPLRAGDLRDPRRLAEKAELLRRRLAEAAQALTADGPAAEAERRVFAPATVTRWVELACAVEATVLDAPELGGDVVAEGAQGLLLDEHIGFHPYTTWSDTTDRHARALLGEVERFGVLRVWPTRHGPGPFPSEDPELGGVMDDHNQLNPWQGPVRVGHFDPSLARYALDALGGVDHLVLTHVDALGRRPWCCAEDYPLPKPGDLEAQQALGRALPRPRLGPPTDALGCIAERVRRVDLVSRGRTAVTLGRP